jgi:predicted dithiol-disulfide oxidoreductase (DUF899 family)
LLIDNRLVDRGPQALDAIAAQRRRLPMVEMPDYTLIGADGPVRLVDVFNGRSQLIVFNPNRTRARGRVDQVLDARGVAAAVSAVVETACSARWGWASESCAQRARVGEDGSDP